MVFVLEGKMFKIVQYFQSHLQLCLRLRDTSIYHEELDILSHKKSVYFGQKWILSEVAGAQ